MKIGFDLDKVFLNYPPFIPDFIIDKFYKKKDNKELIYRIPKKIEQKLRLLTHASFLRKPIKDNIDFLSYLNKNTNHDLYLITSRFLFLEKKTNLLLKKLDLNKFFKKIFLNLRNEQPHLYKNRVIKDLNLKIYIDDDLSLLRFLQKNNSKTNFFWLSNKKSEKFNPNQTIAKISEIKKII